MIDCLIFTKDRACQLELLLRSISDNFKELTNIKILYKASKPEFDASYQILLNKYPEHTWVRETNLVKDIRQIIFGFEQEFSMTLVDDEIIVRNNEITPILNMLRKWPNEVHCASLRLGKLIDYTYTSDVKSPPPAFLKVESEEGILAWDWEQCNPISDWGYPSCINSHIYRTDFFKDIVMRLNFNNVNSLEGTLNQKRAEFKKLMVAFEHPKTFNVANNLVQTGTNRYNSNPEYSTSSLNDKFLSGYRISESDFYDIKINCATTERDYTWKLETKANP